jgi:uncharacterized membrane protein YeiH
MASFFRTKVVKNIGTTPIDVLQTSVGNRFTIIGCNLANTTDDDVIVDITVTDSTAVTGYYIRQLVIAPYTSAKVVTNGEKIILAESTTMTIVADTANSIDLVASYAEIV